MKEMQKRRTYLKNDCKRPNIRKECKIEKFREMLLIEEIMNRNDFEFRPNSPLHECGVKCENI